MLPKRERLSAAEVREVLAKGRSVKGTFASAKFLSGGSAHKIAVIVPKSLAHKATQRNRLRRAGYRALRSLTPPLPQGKIVLFVRTEPKNSPLQVAFAEDFAALLSKF